VVRGTPDNGDEEYFDFPPPLHPLRELTTMTCVALLILAIAIWGVAKMFSYF
jgi:hypothetical protein